MLSFSGSEAGGMSSIGRSRGLWWESNDLRIIYLVRDANKQLSNNFCYVRKTREEQTEIEILKRLPNEIRTRVVSSLSTS